MTGIIEFTNVNREEKELTKKFILEHGGYDLIVDKDPEGNPHFEFSVAVDTLDDLRSVLAIMLFYNMATNAEIKKILGQIKLKGEQQ